MAEGKKDPRLVLFLEEDRIGVSQHCGNCGKLLDKNFETWWKADTIHCLDPKIDFEPIDDTSFEGAEKKDEKPAGKALKIRGSHYCSYECAAAHAQSLYPGIFTSNNEDEFNEYWNDASEDYEDESEGTSGEESIVSKLFKKLINLIISKIKK